MMLRKRKAQNEPESHCHFIYFYSVLAISVLVIVCGMSTLSDLVISQQLSVRGLGGTLRTSVKLSGPRTQTSGNSSLDVSFALVAKHGLGVAAAVHDNFTSMLKFGTITKPDISGAFALKWESSHSLSTSFNIRGFGMVLGELVAFCGKLFAADQATGIVYEVGANGDSYPRNIVMGGDGMSAESLQAEWATVKGGILYMGTCGLRREVPWLSSPVGRVVLVNAQRRKYIDRGRDNQGGKTTESKASRRSITPADWNTPHWIVTIDPSGRVNHLDWSKEFAALEDAAGVHSTDPSMTRRLCHEAVLWSDTLNMWLFLPTVVDTPSPSGLSNSAVASSSANRLRPRQLSRHRRAEGSKTAHSPHADVLRGGDVLLMLTSADFQVIEVIPLKVNDILMSSNVSLPSALSKDTAVFQFSSAKFFPNSGDRIIVAILTVRSVAVDRTWSFLTFLSTDGSQLQRNILIPESETYTYSGLEFL